MKDDQASRSVNRDLKKITRVGRGKRDLILVAGLVVVSVLIGAVWLGFRGSHVSKSAAAMTAATPSATTRVAP